MKKLILSILISVISFNLMTAVPLHITNSSNILNLVSAYEVHTYLGFVEDGNLCDDYWSEALPFIFEPNSFLQINDGGEVYSFGNFSDCFSSFIGYNNCEPIELDWLGQRFYDFKPLNNMVPAEVYPRGTLGLSTGGVGCTSSDVSGDVILIANGPTSYILTMNYNSEIFLDIRYNRYGNALATLSYE